MAATPRLSDLVEFFGAEPEKHPEGWERMVIFNSELNEDKVQAIIEVSNRLMTFSWSQAEQMRAHINVTGISDWSFERKTLMHRLHLATDRQDMAFLFVQMKPYVSVGWATK